MEKNHHSFEDVRPNDPKLEKRSLKRTVSFIEYSTSDTQEDDTRDNSNQTISKEKQNLEDSPTFSRHINFAQISVHNQKGNVSPLIIPSPSFKSEGYSRQESQSTMLKETSRQSSVRKTPLPTIPLIEEHHDYLPCEYEFKGFKTVHPGKKCCMCPPRPSMMNTRGWLVWGFLFVVCWPLTFLPCVMSCSYDPYQIPVYGPMIQEDKNRDSSAEDSKSKTSNNSNNLPAKHSGVSENNK